MHVCRSSPACFPAMLVFINELTASIRSIVVLDAQSSGVVNKRLESDWGSHRVRTDRLLPNFLLIVRAFCWVVVL